MSDKSEKSDDSNNSSAESNHTNTVSISLSSDNDDTRSTCTASTGFGSYADFQSQAELCPSHILKDKKAYLGEGGDTDVEKNPNPGRKSGNYVEKEYRGIKQYSGMLMTVGASICFSFVTLMVKSLHGFGVDAYGSSFWRYVGITIPTIPILMFFECGPGGRKMREKGLKENGKEGSVFDTVWPIFKNDNWKTWIGLFARGLIASTSVILRYYALQYLSIGDTSVITYSTPIIVTILAHFILGERCGVVPVIVTFTTLIGVVIVIKPPLLTGGEEFDTDTLIGTGLALASLFCASLIVIITRKIREVHFALMVCVFGVIGVAQAAIMAFTLGHGHLDVPTQLYDSLLTGGVALLSFFGQIAIILALKFEQAGPVALLRSLDVVFGYILQFAFLGVIPDAFSAIGGFIVLAGIIVIASRKWIKTWPEDSATRKWFGWVLR